MGRFVSLILSRRKEALIVKIEETTQTRMPAVKHVTTQEPIEQPVVINGRRRHTIEEMKAKQEGLSKSRIVAKIVEFDPGDLRDAVVRHCKNCNNK